MGDEGVPSVPLGDLRVSLVDPDEAVQTIIGWAEARTRPRLVVTPNLSMFDVAARSEEFRSVMQAADLSLADGWPVAVAAGRRVGRRLSRTPGSGLLIPLFEAAADRGVAVGLLGGRNPQAAADRCRADIPGLVVRVLDDHMHRSFDEEVLARMAKAAEEARAGLLVLAYGAPKQELLAWELSRRLSSGVLLCVGGGVDFISGDQRRAPGWMQRAGLEAFWRAFHDPRRIYPRYVRPLFFFFRALQRPHGGVVSDTSP